MDSVNVGIAATTKNNNTIILIGAVGLGVLLLGILAASSSKQSKTK
jgi:uncharacterized membrane protein